jgi:hypothetical protein
MPHSPSKQFTVEHIATEPMTARQHEQAVTALAILITAWQHGPAEPDEDPASPLPLPCLGERH